MTAPRSVPAHEVTALRERRARYCIVIPVINEGEKIRATLTRLKTLGLPDVADVIIADGGSTDGSLAHGFLVEAGARTLLVKTGPGKLSAQLRMAYAYALDEGYDGIVTIDGNGKDSEESIPLFLRALDDGIDYAQASRYIPGGKGINTPWTRHLAIRLLHAPALSLAARHRFTDTTQGFRAYSRRYLEDPRVQPFRDVFQSYELLAYLTVRCTQIGYRVCEIPTTRTYPATGKIPTKITASGIVGLLRILFHAVAGHYHPAPDSGAKANGPVSHGPV